MAAFSSPEDLEEWLSDKPAEWAGVLAQRIALRMFPFILGADEAFDKSLWRTTHETWRVLLISSAARHVLAGDIDSALGPMTARATARASSRAAHLDALVASGAHVGIDALDATLAAARAAAYVSALDPRTTIRTLQHLDTSVEVRTVSKLDDNGDFDTISVQDAHDAFNTDATWLEENGNPRSLSIRPLWPNGPPQLLIKDWQNVRHALVAASPLIADWYDRRLQGAATAFNLPPDADLAVIQRIAAAREELWDLEPRAINDTIAGWIKEARAAIKPSNGRLDDPSELAAIAATLSQPVPYALTYTEGADGRLHIDDRALANNLAHDADAVSRYETLRRLAQRLLDACQSAGGNAVAGLTPDVVWLLDSLGEELAAAKPHDLVTATIILRNTLDQQEEQRAARDPDPDLPVYPELVRGALKNLVPQANMVLGLDPYLYEIERAMRRGTNEPQIAPAEGQQAAKGAVDAGVLGDEVPQRLADITRDAPQVPDPENPASRRATREYMALFLRPLGKALDYVVKNAANLLVLSQTPVGVWIIDNFYSLSRWFQNNETVKIILDFFSNFI